MNSEQPLPDSSRRKGFLGVVVDALTFDESIQACSALIAGGTGGQHVVINAGKVVMAQKDARLRAIIRDAEIVNADGQSVVWASRMLRLQVPERVTGIDLMSGLLARAEDEHWRVYLLGARQEVLDSVAEKLGNTYPKLHIVGTHHGYFDDDSMVAREVAKSDPDLLFIAMPSPAKEYFVDSNRDVLGRALSFGVGGSFDVIAGVTKRAPRWMQRTGLEWLYRLLQEPRRMWRRYVHGNSVFMYLVVREWLRRRGPAND